MSGSSSSCSSSLPAALLLVCAIGCFGIADAAQRLEAANQRRRTQLELLAARLAVPAAQDDAALVAFDGLFARPLQRVATATGQVLAFGGGASGGCP